MSNDLLVLESARISNEFMNRGKFENVHFKVIISASM